MKAKEIRELSEQEIAKQIAEKREELLKLRVRKQASQLDQPHKLKGLRNEIARCETILNEKRRAASAVAES